MCRSEKILHCWIDAAAKRGMRRKVLEFMLLLEYLEGDVWSNSFYERKKYKVKAILDSLDSSKNEVYVVLKEFEKRGLYDPVPEQKILDYFS